ncbi:DUF1217 domain-containing protein [Frigidibacter sp. ROC022]|uniref:DUF1217 domain-containing protein n=1 Tax=Frigidibacter sp. ROC022 TaxID=2971796 RepID=UPI00215A372B|nr:DUF1217 domain-containing protein [Frigidibacter sp. ROC022]MCR8724384.1 DUF1217 domain-containing protein [Frigidibacter sp. ROC022]
MSFQPVLPFSGVAGWAFLQRTRDAQQAAFDDSARIQRETTYFRERIGAVETAEDLVSDRRLLQVALGAYGLDADIDSTFFVRKVLADGSQDGSDLANRLADKRYLEMTRAFGLGDAAVPGTTQPGFGDRITAAYKSRQFEVAVGAQSEEMRLALGFGRDLSAILKRQSTENGRWYGVMGNSPVSKVIRSALGLPASFAQLDLDQQLKGFRAAAERVFGHSDVAQFDAPDTRERLIRLFLIRSQAQAGAQTSRGQIALTLLQGAATQRV